MKSPSEDIWWQNFLQATGITWEIGPPMNKDALGHLYWTLGIGGVKAEGAPWPLFASTEEFAQQFYLKYLLENLMGNTYIVWRITPTIDQHAHRIGRSDSASFYTIRSRLTSYPRKPT